MHYASVFVNGNFFIIGGWADEEKSNTIARLDETTWLWSKVGRLNTARNGHAAIWARPKLVVVGGSKDVYKTELDDYRNC